MPPSRPWPPLTRRQPNNPWWWVRLVESANKLGRLLLERGDQKGGLEALQEALAVIERQVELYPHERNGPPANDRRGRCNLLRHRRLLRLAELLRDAHRRAGQGRGSRPRGEAEPSGVGG